MKSISLACLVFFGLTLISCGDDDSICNDFSLSTCDITDDVELALVQSIIDDQTNSFFDIQLLQSTRSLDLTSSYEATMQSCGYEIDSNAVTRLKEINASIHTWCTDLITGITPISKSELDCLYSNNSHHEKYPDTRVYRFSRPVVDKNGKAFITFDDGCTGYQVILEMKQNGWEIVCGGPVSIC